MFVQPNLHFRGELKRCRRRHLLRITLRLRIGESHFVLFPLLKNPTPLTLLQLKHKVTHANGGIRDCDSSPNEFEIARKVRLTRLINRLDCLQFFAKRKAKKGFLKGKNQRNCSKINRFQIIGGIQSLESISNIIYPVLLPLKWTVIHKRCGHGTPLVRPTRSAKID